MKSALVTGVSKGIGREIAHMLSREGYNLYGAYKWSEGYREEEELANALVSEIPTLKLLPFDLISKSNIEELVKQLDGVSLDVIINNAAEMIPNTLESFDYDDFIRVINVNMVAPLLIVQGLMTNLNAGASIVNISSTDASYAGYDTFPYAISKAGLNNITKSLAAILAPKKVRVNAIAPGWVDTDMGESAGVNDLSHEQTPLGRNGRPQEIANVVKFLINEDASYITGSIVTVDGGYSSVDYVIKKESERR